MPKTSQEAELVWRRSGRSEDYERDERGPGNLKPLQGGMGGPERTREGQNFGDKFCI